MKKITQEEEKIKNQLKETGINFTKEDLNLLMNGQYSISLIIFN